MFLRFAFIVTIVFCVFEVWCQDCRFYGQSCNDDFSCCGGCCLNGICKDTYMDCKSNLVEDPCKNRYCPGNQVCFTYQPPGCKGCGPISECRTIPVPKELEDYKNLTHFHLLNSSGSLKPGLYFSHICTVLVIAIRFLSV